MSRSTDRDYDSIGRHTARPDCMPGEQSDGGANTSAAPPLLPVAAAALLIGFMAVPAGARSASSPHNGWYEAGDRGQLNLVIRGNIASQNGWYKKDKKKGRETARSLFRSPNVCIAWDGTTRPRPCRVAQPPEGLTSAAGSIDSSESYDQTR